MLGQDASEAPDFVEGIIERRGRGANDVWFAEIYDLDNAATIHLKNLSTRGRVETNDNVLIGGFILGGSVSTNMIVRGIGPSLTSAGVSGALANPSLELYNAQGTLIDSNDDWTSSANKTAISNSGLAPTNDLESAVYDSLAAGNYTAIVRGANSTTGVGLVEIYELD